MFKKKSSLMALVLLLSLWITGCAGANVGGDEAQSASPPTTASGASPSLTVKVLDVGQGDAILIQTATQTALIDTSDVDERDKLRRELDKAKVKVIDKVILTHPHADHIGGMEVLLKDYTVKEVYDNGMPSTSPIYRSYMKLLKKQGIARQELTAGDSLDLGDGVAFEIYYPTKELVAQGQQKGYKHDPNNESVAGKLIYKDFSMLFTGDGEKSEEQQLLQSKGGELKSRVLKAPHHGSKTSSGNRFMQAVRPEAVIISSGVGNDYGHPHDVTLNTYAKHNCQVYRTDLNGTVTITTDGHKYEVQGEKT